MAVCPVIDRFGAPAGVENLCWGGRVFLILGGPSRKKIDPKLFTLPGIVTFAVNNVAADLIREGRPPNFWTYGDTTTKFHPVIWRCQSILKLVPDGKLKNPISEVTTEKRYVGDTMPRDLPNVLGVRRNSIFDPEKWLWEDTVNWGNGLDAVLLQTRPWLEINAGLPAGAKKKVAEKLLKECLADGRLTVPEYKRMCPYPRVLTTMFMAVRLCYYLGFRTVYLVGCDFQMADNYIYSFEQVKMPGAVGSNNNSYMVMMELFRVLRPHFDKAGLKVINTNLDSALTVFDYQPIEAAIRDACGWMPPMIDLSNWYN